LLGKTVKIDGTLTASGEKPPPDATMTACSDYRPGGGGGSGGTVAVRADTLSGAGSLVARGGGGGDSPGNANDWGWAGGGGGGGRVKVFATTNTFTGTLDSAAGPMGVATCTGNYCWPGGPGAVGTTFSSQAIPNAWTMIGCAGQ